MSRPKGFKHSKETIKKILESRKGYRHSQETIEKIAKSHKGKKLSHETIRKIIESRKGYKTSEETKRKIGLANKGENNGAWKGDEVGYGSLHAYIKYYIPKPRICSICKKEGFIELHNISALYKRDFNDWEWICRKCHMKKDGRLEKLHNKKKLC